VYHNPKKYDTVRVLKWAEKYLNYKVFNVLLKVSEITGYEPVPAELLHRHGSRYGYSGRRIRVGNAAFYLIRPGEMSKGLQERYRRFKVIMSSMAR